MTDDKNKRKLYDALSQDYDMGTFEQFSTDVEDEGKRRKLYDAIKGEYDLPDFDGFTTQLIGAATPQQQTTAQPTGNGSPYQMAQPNAPHYEYGGEVPAVRKPGEQPQEKPLGPEKFAKQMQMQRTLGQMQQRMSQRADAIVEGNKPFGSHKGVQYNPTTQKFEDVYYTKTGEAVGSESARQASNAEIDAAMRQPTVSEELQAAYDERDRLEGEIERRNKEIKEKNKERREKAWEQYKNSKDGRRMIALYGEEHVRNMPLGSYMSGRGDIDPYRDDELKMLNVAKNKNNEIIGVLEREKNNPNFFQTLGKTLFSFDTWDLGLNDITNSITLMRYGNTKQGGKAGEAQEAMMRNTLALQEAQARYSDNDTFWQRAGEITGNAIPFVVEFMATGGGFSGISKATTKIGSKAAAKMGANKFGTFVLKNTGTLAGDMTSAFLMANTTGGMRTTADILERHQGHVTVDENGEYTFEGGKSWGRSIYEGEMANTIEYFTEKLGSTVFDKALGKWVKPAVGGWLSKGAEKMGAGRMSELFSRIKGSEWGALANKALVQGGIDSYPSEVLEEEAGILLNAMMQTGNNEFSDLWDGKTQADIWGGMMLSMGFMKTPSAVGAIYQTAQYYRYKHNTDVSDRVASIKLTPEVWEPLRELIDGTTNEGIGAVVYDNIISNPDMQEEQKQAAIDYVGNLMQMRGYNLRTTANARDEFANTDENGIPAEPNAEVTAVNERYNDGYNADEEDRHDIAIELAMGKENSQEAWDGVLQRIEDDADLMIAEQRAIGVKMQHGDGSFYPAVLKEKDENGNDKLVYIVDGNVQMMADGTMVDPETSDRSVVIFDPFTGERRMIDPTSDMGVLSIGETTTAEDFEYELSRKRDEYVQQQLDEAQGTIRVSLGQQLTMPEGQPGIVTAISPDGESFTVTAEDGSGEVRMEREELQRVADELTMADYQARHQEEAAAEEEQPAEQPEGLVQGAPVEFAPDMEITIMDDEGNEQAATVLGRVRSENFQYVPDENGNIIEYMVDGQVKHDNINQLSQKVVSHIEPVEQPTEEAAMPTEEVQQGTIEQQPSTAIAEEEQPTIEPMPMRVDREADFMATTPERGHQFIYNETGLSREEAGQFVKANIDAANKELTKLKGKAPKMGTSISKYQQEKAALQQQIDDAQRVVDYWNGVKAVQSAILTAEAAERAERDRIAHEAAVAEEETRQAEELAKQQEQAERGANAVHHAIREKWDNAPKVEGVENEITLANGETVKGRYMLVESGAATPSHNPNMEFARNEGFPIDENGQTVNDRDYERDQEAQTITRQMGSNYDSRAIQSVPVVSNDGVVLSGNGRTMAGELAAQNSTDGAYIEHLKKYPQQFGFTPEQVDSMQHPRVVFVPDEAMPYTTDTFAKFNQQDMKSQSRTEQAVKLGKTVDDSTFGRIVSSINSFDTLGDFYNDPVAATNAIGELHRAGAINQMQIAEMMDGEKISGQGRQMLENMLIGKAFESNPDAIRQLSEFPAMRQSIVAALAEIANNIKLGEEYSIADELSSAINLAYQARKAGTKAGEPVSWYARQMNLFPFEDGATVADCNNATVMMLADLINDTRVNQLKKTLAIYNDNAASSAAGQYDIFSGGVKSREDIIKDVLNTLNYGTETEQQQALDGAAERRKAAAGVQEDGTVTTGGAAVEEINDDGNKNVETALNTENTETNGETERDNTEQRPDSGGLREQPAGEAPRGSDGVDIMVLGAQLPTERLGDFEKGSRAEQEEIGHHIIENAKRNGVFIDRSTLNSLGDRVVGVSGESVVYIDEANNRVVKVKDPYAKTNLKGHAASDALYEHIVHNLLFPNTQYRLLGISDDAIGDVRFVLEQDYMAKGFTPATQADIDWYLTHELGLTKVEKPYLHYENDYYSITDVDAGGDNVLIDEDGAICFIDPIIKFKKPAVEVVNYLTTGNAIAAAEAEVDTNPTEGQKKAGNYKMGHVTVDGYDITIENPKGSVRRGTDPNGKAWEQEMHNTYGYIRGTEGVDGDHIDVFLSDDPTQGNVFVVDQVDPSTGKFDEHKVMYGFWHEDEARKAYLSNYEKGWQGLGSITLVSKGEFKKWIESSHRKTKPFSEYRGIVSSAAINRLADGYKSGDKEAIQQAVNHIQKLIKEEIDISIDDWETVEDYEGEDPVLLAQQYVVRANHDRYLDNDEDQEYIRTGIKHPLTLSDMVEASDATVPEGTETEQPGEKQQPISATEEETATEEAPKSKWVDEEDAERFEELKRRLKATRGMLNMGVNPEQFAIGVEMSYLVIKHGARKFGEYAKQMIEAVGEWVRPYLKSFYNGARDLPESAEYEADMTPYDEVRAFDVMNFDKEEPKDIIATAEHIVKENEAIQQATEATKKLKKQRSERRKSDTSQSQLSLFGENDGITAGETDEHSKEIKPEKNNKNENTDVQPGTSEAGRRGQQPQTNGEVGRGTGNETERADHRGVAGRNKAHTGPDGEGSGRVSGVPDGNNVVEPPDVEQPKRNLNNNHAERGKDYAPKDVDKRIEANISAIEKMQQLMESGQHATPDDMTVLRKFSGWGGLGKAFGNTTAVYGVKTTAGRLRELLGDEGYEQANMSRNSAYYTPAMVIDTMWDIARAMGFKGGKVLEGSAGIGNIIGLMPQDISERSDIHAVEIDSTTGNILKLLYPDAKVDVQGFEDTQVENGSVDLAITNVPFVTGLRVSDTTGDKDLSKKFHDIHDFCIAKNIRKLREGGIGIFITSSGTLDNSSRLREWIVQDGNTDVVGAFRLNNETFGGTGATSDIIVVRKRVNGKKSPYAIDVLSTTGERTAEYDTGEFKRVKGEEVPIVKQLSMDYNSYFVNHPEMMGGEMKFGFEKDDTFRPTSKALYPVKGKKQSELLDAWVRSFDGKEWDSPVAETNEAPNSAVYADLGEDVKEGSIVVNNGQLCIAQRGKAVPLGLNANKVKGHSKEECFEAYKGIKEALAAVLEFQTMNESDEGLHPLLDALNAAYDKFVNTYGHLHKNTAISFLKNDVDFANIIALEKFSERGDAKTGKRIQEYGKTDIFSQRVVEKEKAPEPTNVKDGIIASIYVHGRVDVPWMATMISQHTGKEVSESQVKDEIVNSGLGFENPASRQIEVSYDYLSGNVREKLQQAINANTDGRYDANIKALENVIPMNIPAHLIDFSIGSSWIDPKLYEEYVKEKTDIDVTFVPAGGTWFMKKPGCVGEQKNRSFGIVSEMLHKTIMGTELIEAAMTNKTITVSETRRKWDGSTETVTDKDATTACANKIDEIRADFKDWARAKMQSDPDMSAHIERIYNEMFNNYVPRTIPDDFVPDHFGGAATMVDGKPFALRPHQGKAVVRGTTQPLLLAHEVGTGKTYTLITTAMEMRRLGTARKPMIVVQNSTVGQFVESAKKLYPNAKVLTIEDKDHTAEGRKNFYAKIKYNDWDMIVVPQSVFERIPDSEERQMAFIQDKIEEKELVLEQMRNADPDGQSMIVKMAERELEKLQDELSGLTDATSTKRKERDEKKAAVARQNAEVKAREMLDRQTDDVENFDDMGIDALLVDEAHEYKHLGFATAMQRGVKGVDPSYSKKAQGVFLKTQAVMERNNGRNVIFATGTPISNTAAEIWTFMRYLMPADTLKDYDIYYFDDFVRNFGNLTQMLEFTTSGKFKENNRFAGYVNLPELVRIWSGVADTVLTSEAGGVSDKIPAMEGGKAQDIYLPQTKALRSVMKYVKSELDRFDKMTGKQKKEHSYIPLTMYGIAKAAAVDARLVVNDAADEEQSKTNEAVRQTLRSLEETKAYKGTVALFADNYQNKNTGFNLYEDIREKLESAGVPPEQIVVMKSGMSVKKKLEIFDMVNRGDVRVIMGSTFTLGTGVNIQERLHTLIHLDAPNRPMDYTQRNGRILRQGNLHKDMDIPVRVLRFGVEDSLDVTAYQRLKTKGAIADSIMNGKQMMSNSMENRVLEEEEDVFGDTVAQLSGSEYAMLKNQAEKDVRKYENKKKQWEADQTYCHNEIPRLESHIRNANNRLSDVKKSLEKVEDMAKKKPELVIITDKQKFGSLDAMADYIKEYNKKVRDVESDMRENPYKQSEKKLTLKINIGGFDFTFTTDMSIETTSKQGTLFSAIRRKMTYDCPALGLEDMSVKQSLLREGLEEIVNDVITGNDFRERIENLEKSIARSKKELAQVKERDGKPFGYVKELEAAHKHLDEYTELMKKELEEKEKKYAAMDAEVEEATDITEAEEADENDAADESARFRDGDEDDSLSTDWYDGESVERIGAFAGYSRKRIDAFKERHQVNSRKQIADFIEKLNLNDKVTVVDDAAELGDISERKRKAKGLYDTKTGKIIIILNNHHSKDDVMKTIQHEGVAHYGLRGLYGKHFDTFLDNVYENADKEVRGRIVELAKKHGWDFRIATEEYLAQLAENTDFESVDNSPLAGWWTKIKELFWEMLHKLGVEVQKFKDTIGDNELRYLLWRSYKNLTEPGRYRSLVDEAEDAAMQNKLKVGQFEEESQPKSAVDNEEGEERRLIAAEAETAAKVRDIKKKYHDVVFLTKVGDHYEATGKDAKVLSKTLGIEPTNGGVVRFNQDDMNAAMLRMVRAGQRVAIVEEKEPKVAENEILFRDGDFTERDRAIARDHYERMVASSGYQFKEAMQDSMLGLRKAMEAIVGGKKFHIEEIPGNENAYLAENRMSSVNAAEQTAYFREYMQPLLKAVHDIAGNDKTVRKDLVDYMMAKHGLERNAKFAERDAQEAARKGADYNTELQKNRKKDYSGLTALTGNAYTAAAEAVAQKMVDDFEDLYDVTQLWEKVNDATKTTLAKVYKSGMINEETYEQIRDMFEYYIPLRGWDETTSEEVYGYLTSKDGPLRGSTIKHAYGRSSKADDPIATIGLMADTAIRQANRNEMKQRFLTFVQNRPSDLVSVSKLWLQYDAATDEWVPVFADIKPEDTAYDVERKVKAFEQRMEQLAAAEPDKYKTGSEAANIPYKVVKGNISEHQVLVKRDGETFVLTINGNPRAAQALNGITNPDVETSGVIGNMLKLAEYTNRQLSAFYTTRTPDFIVSNFFRDMLYSNCMTWVKENPRYALTFHKNFGKVNPATMRVLFGKWEKGTLDDSKELERQFKSFMMHGGETGYTNVKDIEGHKKTIAAELKRQGNVSRKVWHALGMQLDMLNRSVENCARFAAFLTSQELGRSIDRSIYDAKEVSVNFNKKGSGGKMVNATGQTFMGKIGSYMSGSGRLFYVFWNAGVQGMTNFGRAAKRHPGKFTAGAASMFVLGAVIPLLAQAMGGDDDDDKNAYYNLPEYVRRSNICFRAGKQWITIPLPIEFRAIYGMGELSTGVISGNEHYSDGELAQQMISQMSQVLPLDFMEGGGGLHAFIPSVAKPLVEAASNKGWTGLPIYKDTPWNQKDPEFTKVYKNADKYIVGASKWLNELSGGDDFKKGWADVVNPAQVEYILNGYFGGYFKVPNQLVKMAETAFGDREFEWRNMMIANRLVKSGDERTANRKLQNEYFKYKEEYEETKRLKKKYENAAKEGIIAYAEKIDFLNNSDEYARYEIFEQYRKHIDDLYKLMKNEADEEKRKAIEGEYYQVMREMVNAMHEYERATNK